MVPAMPGHAWGMLAMGPCTRHGARNASGGRGEEEKQMSHTLKHAICSHPARAEIDVTKALASGARDATAASRSRPIFANFLPFSTVGPPTTAVSQRLYEGRGRGAATLTLK